jgi:hypothetical protein
VQSRLRSILRVLTTLAFWILALSPYWMNGFWGDDTLNSSIGGEAALAGTNIWGFMAKINRNWMFHAGRFYPFSWLTVYGGFYAFRPLEVFRVYQMTILVANAALLVAVFRKLGIGRASGRVLFVLLPLFFQLRHYHDPIASYGGLIQIEGIFFCLCTLGLLTASDARSRLHLYSGCALFCLALTASLLTYEVAIVFVPIYLYLLVSRASRRRALGLGLPALAILATYFGIVAYLRARAPALYAGVEIGAGYDAIGATLKQLIAGAPLSYAAFHLNASLSLAHFGPVAGAVLVLGILLLRPLLRALAVEEPLPARAFRDAMLVSSMLVVGPALIVGASQRYQKELQWGVGYLPVYFSAFGLAALLATSLSRHRAWVANSVVATAVATIIASCTALTCAVNLGIETDQDRGIRDPRTALESALENGILNGLVDGDRLVVEPAFVWANSAFLLQHSGKRVIPANYPDSSFTRTKPRPDSALYRLRVHSTPEGAWWATLNPMPAARAPGGSCPETADHVVALALAPTAPRLSWVSLDTVGGHADGATMEVSHLRDSWMRRLRHPSLLKNRLFRFEKRGLALDACGFALSP